MRIMRKVVLALLVDLAFARLLATIRDVWGETVCLSEEATG